jgi:hypothetical protein
MQPNEALGVAAQVAVTLAGFAGIVVVFRPQSLHQWSVLDRLRLILLLMNSAAPLVFALFGMLLLCIDPVPVSIWRWCSGFAFVTDVLVFVYMRNNPKGRLSLNEMQMTSKFVLYAVSVMSMTGVEPFLALLRHDLRSPDGGDHSIPAHAAHSASRERD